MYGLLLLCAASPPITAAVVVVRFSNMWPAYPCVIDNLKYCSISRLFSLLSRNGTLSSGSEVADFPASAAAAAAVEHRPGRFWRPFATHSSSTAAAAAAAAAAAGAAAAATAAAVEARGAVLVPAGLSRGSSGGVLGARSQGQHGGGSRRLENHPSSSADGSSNPDGSRNGHTREDTGGGGGGGDGDGERGQRTQPRPKISLPGIGAWRRSSESANPAKGSLSPPRSRVRQRPSSGSSGGGGTVAGADGDRGDDDAGGDGARSWLSGGRRAIRERRGTAGDIGARGGAGGGDEEDSGGEFFEKVAKVPPWMEGVGASADYEEMKPTLDVIKRTVLLAMLQQVGSAEQPYVGRGGGSGCACVILCVCFLEKHRPRQPVGHCKDVGLRQSEIKPLDQSGACMILCVFFSNSTDRANRLAIVKTSALEKP